MIRMFTKAIPFSLDVLHKGLVFAQMRRHIKIPLGTICCDLNYVTNEECGKKETTCNTADLSNCFRKVIQLELQRRVLRVAAQSCKLLESVKARKSDKTNPS